MSWFKRGKTPDTTGDSPASPAVERRDGAAADSAGTVPADIITAGDPGPIPDVLADLFLMMEEHLNPLELEDSRALLRSLGPRPPLVERFGKGLQEEPALTAAIRSVDGLGEALLALAQPPLWRLSPPPGDIPSLITTLGVATVKGLMLQHSVSSARQMGTGEQEAACQRVWQSCHVASVTANVLATGMGLPKPSIHATRAFLAGMGDLAIICASPELAREYGPGSQLIQRIDAQQRALMTNTAILSSLLVREWDLADGLYRALRHSLTPLTWAPAENQRNADKQLDSILLYLAARVGDAVAFAGLRDIHRAAPWRGDSLETFYIPEYLARLQLEPLLTTFRNEERLAPVQRVIDAVASDA